MQPVSLCPGHVSYFRKCLRNWFQVNARALPWRTTADPYHMLLAEFLLQQTDVHKAVNVYTGMVARYPTVDRLARAHVATLRSIFGQIGLLYRAVRLSQTAKMIVGRWDAIIPADPAQLMQLPGVGRYMANALCSAAFGLRLAVVDTNVVRILERFFGVRTDAARPRDDPMIWQAAQALMPRRSQPPCEWNWAMLDFGALVCSARDAGCAACPVRRRCSYRPGWRRPASARLI
jgi:A/G-specific adenine glycosylase